MLLAGLLDDVEDAVIAVDPDLVVRVWSRGAERVHGWAAEEVLGREVAPVVRLRIGDAECARMRRQIAATGRWRAQIGALRRDGLPMELDAVHGAVHDEDGAPAGFFAIHRDVTERRRLEREHRRLTAIVESSSDDVIAFDADWRYTSLNAGALRAINRALGADLGREDLIGRRVTELFPGFADTGLQAQLDRARRARTTVEVQAYSEPDDRWVEVKACGSAEGVLTFTRDVSARRRAAEERERWAGQQAVLADLGQRALADDDVPALVEEAVRQVVRALAVEHVEVVRPPPAAATGPGAPAAGDLSAPIPGRARPFGVLVARSGRPRTFSEHDVNFLHAVANVLAAAMARDEAEEALNEAREAERRRIARDLHDGALRELSTVTVQADAALAPALQRVGEQLRRAVYDLRMGAEEDRPLGERLTGLVAVHRPIALPCAVELEIGDGVPAHALGARGTEILRIVGEALTNAIRHARARHVHVRVRGSGGTLTAEVCDDGCGIAPGVPEGAGMRGMRERAELLEAGLTIRSGPGSGTTVRVDVQAGDEPVAGIRVLLVEDHAAVREAMAAAFAGEAGFAVVGQAGSLAEARGMLDGVDVAVIDLGLPDGYGPDLIDDLRAASPWAHALVLTASIDRADIAGAVQHGAAGAMSKAVHFDEVVRAVRRLRAGEALLPADEVMELLRSAGRREEDDAAARRALSRLTRRERDVLQAMADGLDSEAVAARLHITLRTQRTHMTRILAKLGVHSALQALVVALRYEVVQARGGPVS